MITQQQGGSQPPPDDFSTQSSPKAALELPRLPQAENFLQAHKNEEREIKTREEVESYKARGERERVLCSQEESHAGVRKCSHHRKA